MSYCVFITRRTNKEGAAEPAITLDEWTTIVDSDAELTKRDDYRSISWRGVSSRTDPSFEWDGGEILAHNPDTAQMTKMRDLAGRLGARVVTEDGFEIEETGDERFDPASAYDYDFAKAREVAHASEFRGLTGFLLYHSSIVPSVVGLALVMGRAAFFSLYWPDYLIIFLAGSTLGLYFYYSHQERRANEFRDWLLRNVRGVTGGAVKYRGVTVNLDTRVTRFQGAYSFVFSNSDWSCWYFVGTNDRGGKWIHSMISIVFGSWGLPLGPLVTAFALLINLKTPPGDMLTVRNLCLRLDDRLCHVIGGPD